LSIKFAARPFAALVFLASVSVFSAAQDSTPQDPSNPPPAAPQQQTAPPAQPSSSTSQQTPTEKEKDKGGLGETVEQKSSDTSQTTNGTSKDRLFYALPNFLTVQNGTKLPPLTVKQKFAVVFRGSFDYVQIPWYAFLAGLSQAENSEPGYGQGAEGYGKRYGSAAADGTIENFMVGAVFPSVLHQDPRFFQLGHGSFIHRALYAGSRTIITRSDSGHSQFNFSEVGGGAAAAFISTYSYHPSADRTVSNTMSVWGTQFGYDTLTLVIKEFWPDIRRKLSHKHDAAGAAPVSENR
jgi:hypothetical protein